MTMCERSGGMVKWGEETISIATLAILILHLSLQHFPISALPSPFCLNGISFPSACVDSLLQASQGHDSLLFFQHISAQTTIITQTTVACSLLQSDPTSRWLITPHGHFNSFWVEPLPLSQPKHLTYLDIYSGSNGCCDRHLWDNVTTWVYKDTQHISLRKELCIGNIFKETRPAESFTRLAFIQIPQKALGVDGTAWTEHYVKDRWNLTKIDVNHL